MGHDPIRVRPLMPVAGLEKLSFGVPMALLYSRGDVPGNVFVFGMFDLSLGAAFRPHGGPRDRGKRVAAAHRFRPGAQVLMCW
jgi:hypothetical protein